MKPIIRDRIARNVAQKPGAAVELLLRRIINQIEFAKAFADSLGNSDWAALADDAAKKLDVFAGDTNDLIRLVADLEAYLSPIGIAAKTYTIHSVGHGHIDMNWMWSWPETVSSTYDTFASMLSFMDQYPEFTYSQSQASVYSLIETYYPEMFEVIKQRVKEGRWEVTASMWVEGDKNLASGEALSHHLLYTREYFSDRFGLKPEDVPIDWEPDTFGHANTIPNILAQGAVKYYYCCRPGGGADHPRVGDARPALFWWQGTDGSRVLVNRETTWYNSYVNIGENFALPMVAFTKETGLHEWLNVYGVGNHGGGPTRDEIDYFIETQSWPIWPTIKFSTSKAYFEAVESEIRERGIELPVIDHELNYEFTGCYTTQTAIKRANRFGENYCVEAEALSVLFPQAVGDAKSSLQSAWRKVLFNHFHDILPGSGVAATREYALGQFQEVGAITGAVKRQASQVLAKAINTVSLLPDTPEAREELELLQAGKANTPFEAGAGQESGLTGLSISSGGGRRFRPVVVFNPCSWVRTEIIKVCLYDLPYDPGKLVAYDEDGLAHPVVVLEKAAHDWGHQRHTLAIVASDIPALGYKTYLFAEGSATVDDGNVASYPKEVIETPFLKAQFDRYHAGLNSVEVDGVEFASDYEPLGTWKYVVEQSRGMTAWVLGGIDGETIKTLPAKGFSLKSGHRNEATGAHEAVVPIAVATWNLEVPGTKSKVTLHAVVGAKSPRIDFIADIDWREIGDDQVGIPGLVIDFETPLGSSEARFETPYGTVTRPTDGEDDVPTLRYASIQGDRGGFTLLQDSKYAHQAIDGTLSLRVVRSSYDPDHAPEVGKSTLTYSMVFHQDTPSAADLTRLGAEANHPLIVFPANLQSGGLPVSASYAEVLTPDVVLAGLKQGESGGTVLRLVNYSVEETVAKVKLDPSIATGTATVIDLMERQIDGAASFENGVLSIAIAGNSFVSVKIG